MEVFIDLNRKGQTIFMVTHNQENAALADRVLEIKDGSLVGCCVARRDQTKSPPVGANLERKGGFGGIHRHDTQHVGCVDDAVNAE